MSKPFLFYLEPGWAENRWKTSDLLKQLEAAGGRFAKKVEKADIIIAHSAGCHMITSGLPAQLVVLIGPTYCPGRSLLIRAAKEWLFDSLFYFRNLLIVPWLLKNIYYLVYGLLHPLKSLRIFQLIRQPLPEATLHGYKTLVIRNIDDYFCDQTIDELVQAWPSSALKKLPGRHDDIWVNPRPYIETILKAYN